MTDVLLEIGKNPQARKLLKTLGLPLPLPESLRRDRGAIVARPLADRKVVVGGTRLTEVLGALADTLAAAGADPFVEASLRAPFVAPGETFGRPARELDESTRPDAVIFDATAIADPADLKAIYAFFHPLVSRLARSSRVLVIARPTSKLGEKEAAAQGALEGFVRSVAKEIGRNGSTANLVVVERGAEDRLAAVLRFALSARSAFVTAQPIAVDTHAKAIAEPPMVRSLEKKLALVTGAARGIGAATARALAAEGAKVVCLDRPADDAETAKLAREIGGVPLLVDMSDPEAPAKIAEQGPFDIVVHNAGITRDKTLARMKPEGWDQVLDVNLAAVVRVQSSLEMRDGGRVICLSSIAGIAGNVGQTAYAASKSGIVGYVSRASDRLASRGITVNAIAPGFIETRLTAAIPFAIREVARRLSALGQGGLPEDVANAITFLATPGAQGITGRVLRVCGGAFVGK
ncbi:MAG: 3-oxoacyl-ACP reductase [Polyangiales bacterium]